MENPILVIEHLEKSYGHIRAVQDLSLVVPRGSVFGLLGPNGAGKTTTLEMVEGLRRPDNGRVVIDGLDVWTHLEAVKGRIGIQLQSTSFFDRLTVRETLLMFAALYPRSVPVDPLIARLDLADKAHVQVRELSGGQRQRLAVGLALVNDPVVVFLDEPTAGLDPQARRALWDLVRELRTSGTTVVLTTHYMDEAEQLCDQLVVMDHGRVIAQGTPHGLITEYLPDALIELDGIDLPEQSWPAVTRVERIGSEVRLYTTELDRALIGLVEWAEAHHQSLKGLRTRSATLEDLFLTLTGRSLRD